MVRISAWRPIYSNDPSGTPSPPSPRIAPEPLNIFRPLFHPLEGVGNAGCPMHPQPVRKKVHTVVTTVAPESPGIPAREWF